MTLAILVLEVPLQHNLLFWGLGLFKGLIFFFFGFGFCFAFCKWFHL